MRLSCAVYEMAFDRSTIALFCYSSCV